MKKIIVIAVLFVFLFAIVRADDVNMNISVNGTANFNINVSTEDSALRQDVYGAGRDQVLNGTQNQTTGSMSAICSDPSLQQYFSDLSSMPPANFTEEMKTLGYGDEAHIDTIWNICERIYVQQGQSQLSQDIVLDTGGGTDWDIANTINNAMDNLDGKGAVTPASTKIANALANHFVTRNEYNYAMNAFYSNFNSRLTNIEIRQMILEKAMNMTNPTTFCDAKKEVLTELGLIFIKCDDAVYWYKGIEINMSPESPVAVKIITPDNTANVILYSMQEINITNSTMESLTVEIGNKGNTTETAVISLELPSNFVSPKNYTITLAPNQLEAMAFLIKRDIGDTCISNQDCRIGTCMPVADSNPSEKICEPKVYFKAPLDATDGGKITVQMLSEEGKPMVGEEVIVESRAGNTTLTTDSEGNVSFIGLGGNVYEYTSKYLLSSVSSTNVLMPTKQSQLEKAPETKPQVQVVYPQEEAQPSTAMATANQSPLIGGAIVLIVLVALLVRHQVGARTNVKKVRKANSKK